MHTVVAGKWFPYAIHVRIVLLTVDTFFSIEMVSPHWQAVGQQGGDMVCSS